MDWFFILLAVIAFILLFIFFVSLWAYHRAFYSPANRTEDIYDIPDTEQYQKEKDTMIALIAEMDALPFERVYITSHDGLKLSARYYHLSDGAPLQIQFPGYKGSSVRDFCGGHKLAREYGFNTLVVDQRAHGMSEGRTISFGINEQFDCLRWIDYACNRFGSETSIYLAGVSMGGATVLLAAQHDLPTNVKGIIADCPFSSPAAIIKKVCADMKLPPNLAYPFVVIGARLFGKFNINKGDIAQAVKKADKPILIIHGEDDLLVPCDMSREIANSSPSKVSLATFANAGHGISYIVDPKRYAKVAMEFINKCENK